MTIYVSTFILRALVRYIHVPVELEYITICSFWVWFTSVATDTRYNLEVMGVPPYILGNLYA